MDAYQELLSERNKLAAQVAAQAVEINALEQSVAVRLGKRLKRFAPVLYQLLRVARVLRRLRNKLRRPMRVVADTPPTGDGTPEYRKTVFVAVAQGSTTARGQAARGLMRALEAESYRVVAVLLGTAQRAGFADAASVVLGPYQLGQDDDATALATAEGLAAGYDPHFVIACGAETRHLATPLSATGVPLIALVHELPMALVHPNSTTRALFDRADDIVFSCRAVADLYGPFYGRLDYRRTHVIAPGHSSEAAPSARRLRDRLTFIPDDSFLVLGLGNVEYRSGVDLFIATASAWRQERPKAKFHFVWMGKGPDKDYALYIDQQITRAGIGDSLSLLFESGESKFVYNDVPVLYAPARLDYLPIAAVDYALAAIPVVAFANAGGIGEVLGDDPATARLVVPHMDIPSAVVLLDRLARDKALAEQLGQAAQERVRQAGEMASYARQLIAFGEDAARARGERPATATLLAEAGNFDTPLYTGKPAGDPGKIIAGYLERSHYDGFRKRALAGFHPELYASRTPDFKALRLDPLTHYLKADRPAGPWLHKVIALDRSSAPVEAQARIAVQGHFYYVDHIGVLLKALAANRSRADLFLTTGSEANRDHLLRATRAYVPGSVTVEIVPNKGRDIGPFLHQFRETLYERYDFVGHVHGKRSVHTAKWDPNLGERWRNFLFQHLLGPKAPVMDRVLAEFAADPALGLVFPEDRNVIGWDFDFEHAQRLAERMAFRTDLPKHIDFPIGTMFWARSKALEPLLRLELTWDDYPDEPLPVDGTILHALERLIPSIAREAGYDYATTHFPGIGY